MNELSIPRERLVAIFMADAVGYSRLMRADERATVQLLDEYRSVFRQKIEAHGGRIADMAGDSILAVFETATGAVRAADEAQREVTRRNADLSEDRQMNFRVGINLGDILEKNDGSVYGDGLNVAARLQAMASTGGVNVSGSVFESVRAKVPCPFTYLGKHTLKNISTPVDVYKMGDADGLGESTQEQRQEPRGYESRPTVYVKPLKVISGDATVQALAEGLHEDIVGGLTKQTAIEVVSALAVRDPDVKAGREAAFSVDGSVQAAGERLRLSFMLVDSDGGSRIWSERYDRHLDDIFDLEDEISRKVAAAVRIRIKAREFEKLRDTEDEALLLPGLLSKAAGYFVDGYGHNDEAARTLRVALERMPDNSMANAMMVLCRYRMFEFDVFDLAEDVKNELLGQAHKALSLDRSSYFAHVILALLMQDIRGDYASALIHAESALELNRGFSQATAMCGIAKIHLGDTHTGLDELNSGIAAAPQDPHRFRHQRELAVGYFVAGDLPRAAATIDKLVHQAPELQRNELVAAGILMRAGRERDAQNIIEAMVLRHPGLTHKNMRPIRFGNADAAESFTEGLTMAGLPA